MERRRLRLNTSVSASPLVHLPRNHASPFLSVARRLVVALLIVVVVALVVYADRGGYHDNSGASMGLLDCLYYATVTLSTTGYGDVVPASDHARLINVLVVTPLRVLFLIILVGTTLEVLTERTREQVRQTRWRTALQDHTVIVGYGTKGRSAVSVLLEDGLDPERIVVVDNDAGRVAEASADGLAVVQGDATRAQVLGRAKIASASRVIIAMARDDSAVLVTLTVRASNRTAHLIAAVRESENAPLLRHSGADQVVVSSEAAGRLLGVASASPATGSVLADLIERGTGLDLTSRPVREEEVGRSHALSEDRVLAVVRGGQTLPFTDPTSSPLQAGDVLVVVGDAA